MLILDCGYVNSCFCNLLALRVGGKSVIDKEGACIATKQKQVIVCLPCTCSELTKDYIVENSKIFGRNSNSKLTKYQQGLNEAAMQLCLKIQTF